MTESEHTVLRKLTNPFPRLTYRRLMVVYASICLCIISFVCVLSRYQYDTTHVNVQKTSLNWMLRGVSHHAPTVNRPHHNELKDSLGNVYIKHQYEDWLQHSANKTFDLRPESGFMKQQASIQRQRKRALQQVCRKHPELSDVTFTGGNTRLLFVAEKSSLFYCVVPKERKYAAP
ncbi:uncharacterized protein LOC119736654 [Patiria miniata]|uniref:Uncharacterized protein n=1 Tax=Patiria miniata TaxID=46514 RepID=A0A914AS49_PATMI|nr:uncharacterized protein LOC119736654 [Patiria miniata]